MLKTRLNAFGLLFFTFYVTTVCFADGAVQTCGNPRLLTYQVVETISKVPRYTEGLIFLNGELVESAGDYGKSSISRLDSKTGKVIASTGLDAQYFAEGLTFFTGQFFQLTYREHQAFVYDSTQLGKIKTFSYEGEGWGLTSNDQNLIMSNGSSELNFLDPLTFKAVRSIDVKVVDRLVEGINELEFAHKKIFANLFMTDYILEIDQDSGCVESMLDMSGLISPDEKNKLVGIYGEGNTVLNGIAFDPIENVFYVTGKNWSKFFKIKVQE